MLPFPINHDQADDEPELSEVLDGIQADAPATVPDLTDLAPLAALGWPTPAPTPAPEAGTGSGEQLQ